MFVYVFCDEIYKLRKIRNSKKQEEEKKGIGKEIKITSRLVSNVENNWFLGFSKCKTKCNAISVVFKVS